MSKVLIVHDDADIRLALSLTLEDAGMSVGAGADIGCGATVGNGSSSLPHAITVAATSAPMIKAIDLIRLSPYGRYEYRIFNFSLCDQFRINQPRVVSWSTSGVTDTRISPGRANRFTEVVNGGWWGVNKHPC